MKAERQAKIRELVRENSIETQEELQTLLELEGYPVTQATVSRDLRELALSKGPAGGGRQKYVLPGEEEQQYALKYSRVLAEGLLSMEPAGNLLVLKTVSGMAGAVCASLDAMYLPEIVGSIAGDDTIMCAVRSPEDGLRLMKKIRGMLDR